jgi:PAS domain-containing protein
VDTSLELTQRLVEEAQLAAQQRAHYAVSSLEFAALSMLTLLIVLSLGMVEPLARFLRRQQQAMLAQAGEIKRLALVAERTSNWVAVVDARRHVLWCNQAFLRGKGCTFEDIRGKLPGLLRANERNDAAEIERLLFELDM